MYNITYRSFLFIFILITLTSEKCDRNELTEIINNNEVLKPILTNKDKYELQIRYTQIDRDKNDVPSFTSYDLNVDNDHYFYPASTVKMPTAVLALQYLREMQLTGYDIDIYSTFEIDSSRSCQSAMTFDDMSGKKPCVKFFLEEIFAISDNNAYNRLYELLGQKYINENLYSKGVFSNSQIIHRVGVSGYSYEENKYINPMIIHGDSKDLILGPRMSYYPIEKKMKAIKKGKGYIDNDDKLILHPFDFKWKNVFTIIDLEACLKRILFPESFTVKERFGIKEEDYQLLYRTMLKLPKEIDYLANDNEYYDGYVKFFYNGHNKLNIPNNIKIMNKVGDAYGTLTDCSYIFDIETGAEFLLTATINVNTNGIYNDGIYDYETIGLPFMHELGQTILSYEQSRPRNYKSNFSKYLQAHE